MTFANPQFLWLLLVLPPGLVVFFWWSWQKRRSLMSRFIQSRLLPGLLTGLSSARQKMRLACLVLAVTALILALARPQWGFSWEEVKQRGVDIVVAIDTSKSMLAEDIAPSRLARAKLAALDLMQLARNDRLGLVAFAGAAFLPCPLTIDDAAFRQSVEMLDVNTISQGGTALAEAIESAASAFKEADNEKVVVILSDGEDQNQETDAVEAARKAAAAGVRIFTVGIGTTEGELLRIKGADGRTDYVRDEQGNVVKSHLNERLLQGIAAASEGGGYMPLRGANTIDTLYADGIAGLRKSEHQERLVKQYFDRFHWPLGLAILLLIAEILIPERKRDGRAGAPGAAPAKSVPAAAVLLLLLLGLPDSAQASPSGAMREYKSGNYEGALKEYEQLIEKKNDDPRLRFNAGAAAYRAGQFDEALKQFNEAANAQDLNLQQSAYYNRGNTLYYLGEQNPDPAKRTESWEKAIKDFDLSLKLNPQDTDAKYNQEFIKKRLEELKQQQQQQQQSDQNKSDQQKQDQQQQQQQQNQQQQDQQKQDQQQQQQQQSQSKASEQQKEPGQQQQQAQQQKPEDKQQQEQAKAREQKQQQEEKQKQQQAEAKPGEKSEQEQQEQAAAADGQMTPEQARQIMDAQKGDEKMLMLQPEGKPSDRNRTSRDW